MKRRQHSLVRYEFDDFKTESSRKKAHKLKKKKGKASDACPRNTIRALQGH